MMMDIDQPPVRDARRLCEDRHEVSRTRTTQRAEPSGRDPRNKTAPVATDRYGARVFAKTNMGRSRLLGIIAHAVPSSRSAMGLR
jgi:hypothetical protein